MLQRLLGEKVQRESWSAILGITTSVGLASFDDPEFFDDLQRVKVNAARAADDDGHRPRAGRGRHLQRDRPRRQPAGDRAAAAADPAGRRRPALPHHQALEPDGVRLHHGPDAQLPHADLPGARADRARGGQGGARVRARRPAGVALGRQLPALLRRPGPPRPAAHLARRRRRAGHRGGHQRRARPARLPGGRGPALAVHGGRRGDRRAAVRRPRAAALQRRSGSCWSRACSSRISIGSSRARPRATTARCRPRRSPRPRSRRSRGAT